MYSSTSMGSFACLYDREGRATIRLFFEIDGLTWIGLDWIIIIIICREAKRDYRLAKRLYGKKHRED
jgi:hypothetical protein